MLSKLTRNNQITIPMSIIKRAGLKIGRDYIDVEYINGIIYLKPVDIEERVPYEDLEKLKKKALKEEKSDVTLSAKEAEGFLARRLKRN